MKLRHISAIIGSVLMLTALVVKLTESDIVSLTSWNPIIEKTLTDAGVDNVEDCLRWAFGSDYKKLNQRDLDDRWRQRHSELFVIKGSDDLVESTKRIARAWLDDPNPIIILEGRRRPWMLEDETNVIDFSEPAQRKGCETSTKKATRHCGQWKNESF